MKQKKTSLSMQGNTSSKKNKAITYETPLRQDAFIVTDEEKVKQITKHVEGIMSILGLDLSDDSLKDTPERVAKMYVKEIFKGLNPANKPHATLFKNKYNYNGLLIEKNITLYSTCEHHLVPIIGIAHVAYISTGKIIGLSKINRIVKYYARRPQVQERLTIQIAEELKSILDTNDIAVFIDAKHLCVLARGVEDNNTTTITSYYSGKFKEKETKEEFLNCITKA